MQIQFLLNFEADFLVIEFGFIIIEEPLHFFIQKVSDLFHHGDGVGFFVGMLTEVHQLVKKLVHIGHIEISSHHQISASPVVLANHRVAFFN